MPRPRYRRTALRREPRAPNSRPTSRMQFPPGSSAPPGPQPASPPGRKAHTHAGQSAHGPATPAATSDPSPAIPPPGVTQPSPIKLTPQPGNLSYRPQAPPMGDHSDKMPAWASITLTTSQISLPL